MTRETKIGLLVGLAFIIVVGILINDYRASSMQPPPAALMNTAQDVRDSNNALAMRRLAPLPERQSDVQVPLVRAVDVEGPRRSPEFQGSGDRIRIVPPNQGTRDLNVMDPAVERTPPVVVEEREARRGEGASDPDREMEATRRPGDETEDVTPRMFALREYKAEPGDTISRMARKFLGSGSKENLDAIVKVNPELRANPNKIVAGTVYKIPTQETGAATVQPQPPVVPPTPPTTTEETVTYTTKPGDSLWKIANTQCGSGAMTVVNRIRELNKDVIKGDIVKPNMTLKLPKKAN